jgi:hypothetical protein
MTGFALTESAPGQGEGRLNPRTYWEPGPVWAFGFKIEKLILKAHLMESARRSFPIVTWAWRGRGCEG